MGFNCGRATEPLQGDRLPLIAKSPGISHTHLIDSEIQKAELTVELLTDFKPRTPVLVI